MTGLHSDPYGVGIAYRYVLQEGILKHRDSIDLIEVPTEDYIIHRRRIHSDPDEALLREVLSEIPGVAHGISLSIGSVEPLDRHYLKATRRLMERHDLNVFSEHLAFHRMNGDDLSIFLALPFEEASVQWIKSNYQSVREALGRPFALENVTYYFPAPKNSLSEADFLRRLTEETDCTLLLDVTNVFNNAHNHGYDPIAFFDRLPMDRVSQLHLAGGELRDGKWEDCHNSPVMEPVWELFEEVLRRCDVGTVILERDSKFEPFEAVMEDVFRAREIFYRHRPSERSRSAPSLPIPAWNGDESCDLAWRDGRHEQLRGFELAVMERITSAEFRDRFRADPGAALEPFGLSDDWKERVRLCDPPSMAKLAKSWDGLVEETRRLDAEETRREWAAWAQVLPAGERGPSEQGLT